MRKPGQITVFLSLLLVILLSLVCTVIEGARRQVLRMQIENGMDIAVDSVLAEYDRDLLEQYELFFLDSSYGGEGFTTARTEARLEEFLSFQLNPGKDLPGLSGLDPYRADVRQVMLMEYGLASDHQGAYYYMQAVDYMKKNFGLDIAEDLTGLAGQVKLHEQEGKALEQQQIADTAEASGHEEDPAALYKRMKKQGILKLALNSQEQAELSSGLVRAEGLLSNRSLKTGTGNPAVLDGTAGSRLLFQEYIFRKFVSYTDIREEERPLAYEIEYILGGKAADLDNLKYVANRLLLIRFGSNMGVLLKDSARKGQARALALGLSLALLTPGVEEALYNAILLLWAFEESVADVGNLLKGGKAPLVKTKEQWQVPLTGLFTFFGGVDGYIRDSGEGLDYEAYLRVLLFLQPQQETIMRSMDIIELNMRQQKEDPGFCLDHCFQWIDAEAVIETKPMFPSLAGLDQRFYIQRKQEYRIS